MRYSALIIIIVLVFAQTSFSQQEINIPKESKKGDFYFYWGWNWSWYTKSDIGFTGADYDFILSNVSAKDRPSPFDFDIYFNPKNVTIPQYNFRLGYFFNDHYSITAGIDHMKYVVQTNQASTINGWINGGTDYDGVYVNDDITIKKGFLQFEHTDGLNYANIGIRRFDNLFEIGFLKFAITEGVETGILLPRTNTTLMNKERYDEFHLSGYGLSAMVGLNIIVINYFFIQTELKGGYINMPDIRTTGDTMDKARQNFWFTQCNILFGFTFNLL